jgi:hypothetical protein
MIVMDLSSSDDSGALAPEYGGCVVIRAARLSFELRRKEVARLACNHWILVPDPMNEYSLAGRGKRGHERESDPKCFGKAL